MKDNIYDQTNEDFEDNNINLFYFYNKLRNKKIIIPITLFTLIISSIFYVHKKRGRDNFK